MSATKSERVSALERLLPSILLGVSVALLLAGGVRQKNAAVRQGTLNEAIRNQIGMQVELERLDARLAELDVKLEALLRALRNGDSAGRAAASVVNNAPALHLQAPAIGGLEGIDQR